MKGQVPHRGVRDQDGPPRSSGFGRSDANRWGGLVYAPSTGPRSPIIHVGDVHRKVTPRCACCVAKSDPVAVGSGGLPGGPSCQNARHRRPVESSLLLATRRRALAVERDELARGCLEARATAQHHRQQSDGSCPRTADRAWVPPPPCRTRSRIGSAASRLALTLAAICARMPSIRHTRRRGTRVPLRPRVDRHRLRDVRGALVTLESG